MLIPVPKRTDDQIQSENNGKVPVAHSFSRQLKGQKEVCPEYDAQFVEKMVIHFLAPFLSIFRSRFSRC